MRLSLVRLRAATAWSTAAVEFLSLRRTALGSPSESAVNRIATGSTSTSGTSRLKTLQVRSVPCRRRRTSAPASTGEAPGGAVAARPRRGGRGRRRGLPAGRDRALGAAGAGDQRPQRRRGEHQLQLAGAGGGIDGDHRGVELGQGQGEDHEVRDVAQHQADPGALADAHRLELLGAAIDAVEQAAPGQVVVPVDQGLVVALDPRGALQPLIEERHRGGARSAPRAL